MKFYNFVPASGLLFSLFSAQLFASQQMETQHSDFSNFSSSCGGILRAEVGSISYKTFEPVDQNERCVWILRAPNVTSYTVYATELGIPYSLIMSGFSYSVSGHTLTPSKPYSIIYMYSSNTVFITFYTNITNIGGYGFSLDFYAYNTPGEKTASSLSEEIILPANYGHIKYPSGRETYDNNELTMIYIQPSRNSVNLFKKVEVLYTKKELQVNSCSDSLQIWNFDPSSIRPDKWDFVGYMCFFNESRVFTNNDLIRIVFVSDANLVNTGFHLYTREIEDCQN